jgi:hypothetical protein
LVVSLQIESDINGDIVLNITNDIDDEYQEEQSDQIQPLELTHISKDQKKHKNSENEILIPLDRTQSVSFVATNAEEDNRPGKFR